MSMTEEERQAAADREKALAKIKEVVDDGFAEINGNRYHYSKMTHNQRRRVFAYFTGVQHQIQVGDFSFLDRPDWQLVENVICDTVLFEDVQISKRRDHWEEFSGDYLAFITTSLGVISYPFMKGAVGS